MGWLRMPLVLACLLGVVFTVFSWLMVFGQGPSPLVVIWVNWLPIVASVIVFAHPTGPSHPAFLMVAFLQYAIVVFVVAVAIARLRRRR